jgi:single-strand DNA-binding protein
MLNNCNFIGRLGNDPETAFLPDGKQVTKLSIACGEKWKDKSGTMQEKTEWVRVVSFGKLAEIISKYLVKGSLIYISGKMSTTKYTDKNGVEKYSTEIIANEMKMLDGKPSDASNNATAQNNSTAQKVATVQNDSIDLGEDDIPFS